MPSNTTEALAATITSEASRPAQRPFHHGILAVWRQQEEPQAGID